MTSIYLIYSPLVLAIFLVVLGAMIYYNHRYEIGASNTLNKYRLPQKHILIKLKLFKYNNNFNYFLLVPYLIAWLLFLVVFVLYVIYWCGLESLARIFDNKWMIFSLFAWIFIYMVYGGFIQQKILYSNRLEGPSFKMEKKQDLNRQDDVTISQQEIKKD